MGAILKVSLLTALTAFLSVAYAVPEITVEGLDFGRKSRLTVKYSIDAAALVTVDFQTNGISGWASIGLENFTSLSGDVNRVVAAGSRQVVWNARADWPDHRFDTKDFRAVLTAHNVYDPPLYMVVDLERPNDVRYYVSAAAVPGGVTDRRYKTTSLLMRRIPAAGVKWLAGSESANPSVGEYRRHYVTLGEDYYIGVYEMTQRQYWLLTGTNPSADKPADWSTAPVPARWEVQPVEQVPFSMARGSCNDGYDWPNDGHDVGPSGVLQQLRNRANGIAFDFPTCAQWEFACRAGTDGASYGLLADVAWTYDNWQNDKDITANGTHEVGLLQPNDFGLYDMLGNVWEFCLDWMSPTAAAQAAAEESDPTGPSVIEPMSDRGNGGRTWRGGTYAQWYTVSATSPYTWGVEGGNRICGFRVCCPAVAK